MTDVLVGRTYPNWDFGPLLMIAAGMVGELSECRGGSATTPPPPPITIRHSSTAYPTAGFSFVAVVSSNGSIFSSITSVRYD
jgi:hypothetical protein